MSNADLIKLEVTLGYVYYPKNSKWIESGEYGIFSANVQKVLEGEYEKSNIKLRGNCPKVVYGCTYKVYCTLSESHPKYGDTYDISYISRCADISTKEKQYVFLSQVITNTSALDNLFKTYDDVIELLENEDYAKLTSISGIGMTSAKRMINAYNDQKDYSDIYIELGSLNLTPNMIKKLCDFYKSPEAVVKKVRENPYSLVEMDGMGFKKCDEIALKVGIDKYDMNRICGYILHYLREQGELGKTWVLYSELMHNIYDVLGYIPEEILGCAAKSLMDNKKIHVSDDAQKVSHTYYYNLEMNIFNEIIRLNSAPMLNKSELDDKKSSFAMFENSGYVPNIYKLSDEEVRDVISNVEEEQGFQFNEEQLNAIKMSNETNVLVVTGYGGTGKSTTARGMCKLNRDVNVIGVALSGKASMRITETTGLPAYTIHRALGWQFNKFTYDKDNKLEADIVLIDESTMINGQLFYSLLQAIPTGAKVIMLGDVHQITPIGSCQVFADLLNSDLITSIRLIDIHRQAKMSGIVPTSIKISTQQQLFDKSYTGDSIMGDLKDMRMIITDKNTVLSNVVCDLFKEEYDKYKNIKDVQICCLMRNRGDLCIYNLNNKIQEIYNPKNNFSNQVEIEMKNAQNNIYYLRVGDKVINKNNNYRAVDINDMSCVVFNGSVGIIIHIEDDKSKCIIDFDGIGEVIFNKKEFMSLDLAYAITTHKSQGSEYTSVIVAIDDSSYIMNNAEVLYTSVTRAKKNCILLGTNSAIRHCISHKEMNTKQTYLLDKLNNYAKEN